MTNELENQLGNFGESTSGASQGSAGAGLSSVPGGKARGFVGTASAAAEGWSEQLKQSATEAAERAGDIATDVAQRAQDLASQATDTVGTTIRRYPLQSLLVGFSIGAAIGLLLPSRR